MIAKKRSQKYIRFAVYLLVVVLINIVGMTLFFRWDLTKNKVYSLSDVSKTVVSTLTEPLTIKVFFTKDLKAPYNNIERYLRDLLEEYAVYGNRFFNYQFFDVSPQSEGIGSSTNENQQMATSYGIQPVQIQMLEKDELVVKRAYMGLAIIHGDIVERIPTITSTDGLEYTLTTTFQRVNNKISALLGLTENIRVKLLLSDSLKTVAPLMGLDALPDIPETVETIINKLNQKNYNRLTYTFEAPATDAQQETATRTYNVMHLKWPDIEKDNVVGGSGVIGLVMSYGEKTVTLPILQVLRIPIIGTQYQLASREEIEEMIDAEVETLVDINESIGYLADHGALSLSAGMMSAQQDPSGTLSTFSELLGKTYSPREFSLSEESLPRDVQSIIVARPTEPFTDYELFQLDQALMRGQNLILFLDPFKEVRSQEMNPMGFQSQPSTFVPVDTGLEKLLAHWGVGVAPSIVMDKNCYQQNLSRNLGGGKQSVYFAPIIKSENIDHSLPMTRNIKELVVLRASPLTLNEKTLEQNSLKATVLFSSSDESWEMNAPINLNPMYHSPPGPEELEKKPLACLIEGRFPSYFAGKPIPEKTEIDDGSENTEAEDKEETLDDADMPDPVMSRVESEGGRLDTGRPAKIFLMGSGEMLKNNLVDAEGKTPNGMLVMNMIDALNQHDDVALMRSKTQRHNPLDETSVRMKTTIKAINIGGLPILVVLFGLLVWMRRHARKNSIRRMFETE